VRSGWGCSGQDVDAVCFHHNLRKAAAVSTDREGRRSSLFAVVANLLVLLALDGLGRCRSSDGAGLVGLEVELDEEEQVGEDDGAGQSVGPNGLPGGASGATCDSGVVHDQRNDAASDVQAELDDLELGHVLLPPKIDLEDGAEIVVVLLGVERARWA